MKMIVSGKKFTVDKFVRVLKEHYGGRITVTYSEQYLMLNRMYGNNNYKVTVIIYASCFIDKAIWRTKEFRYLDVKIEPAKGRKVPTVIINRPSMSVVDDEVVLDEYEELELYEMRLNRG